MPKSDHASEEQKLRVARARLAFLCPYFSHAAYALVPIASKSCPTIAVDKYKRLYWNPDYVALHDVNTLATILMHELGHLLRDHHERARAVGVMAHSFELANFCMDAELNDDIRDEVEREKKLAPLPSNVWYPSLLGQPDYLTWEQYYFALLDMPRLHLHGVGGYDCGSGAHGYARPWEAGDPNGRGSEVESVSHADWRDVKRLTAEAIKESARQRGNVPDGWLRWAEEILQPKPVQWETVLAAGLRRSIADVAGVVFHSYKRPSRRQSALKNVILPSMRRPLPRVACVGDTSGSMDETDLALVRGVVRDICTSLGAHLTFLSTDAEVHGGAQQVWGGKDAKLAGGGGTDMRVGIEAATRLRPPPDVIVVTTDCATPWPDKKPRQTVIVCDVSDGEFAGEVPGWAQYIHVRPGDARSGADEEDYDG